MVEVTDTVLTGRSVTSPQVDHSWEDHNLHPMVKEIMLTTINLTVLGVQEEMVDSMEHEVLEVVKVSLLFRSFTDECS